VYVADTGLQRVVALSRSGRVLNTLNNRSLHYTILPAGSGPFNAPSGVTADQQGNVYVANAAGNCVTKISPSGQPVFVWGTCGPHPGLLNHPVGVAVDLQGNVYIADTGNNRIQVFHSSGQLLVLWGSKGRSSGQFNQPDGVAVDRAGNVYVADAKNGRIVKFGPA
jgi:DNA-binding beta-propeller fold protein YncE